MKSFTTAFVLALTASATAAPSLRTAKRQNTCIVDTSTNPDSTAIIASIDQWFSDVSTVNAYLNNVHTIISTPSALLSATQNVLLFAQDEPCQLSTLLNNPDAQANALSDAFACAAADLGNVFKAHVLDNLNAIIDDPANVDAASAAVADINVFRCCNVLPDVDLLWVDSADDFGVADRVPITAPREDACAAVDCGDFATSATCKALGQ